MTITKIVFVTLMVMVSQLTLAACPGGTMSTGWCWPTGAGNWTNDLAWHGSNPGFNGLHLAKDIDGTEGDPIYAMGYGVVLVDRSTVGYYGGGTNCRVEDGKRKADSISGGGVILRHYTSTGKAVDVLYAHLKDLQVKKGDVVVPGQMIAKIRNYTWCGARMDHLHLGAAYPARDLSVYDRGTTNYWVGYGTSDLGFVNPVDFFAGNNASTKLPDCNPSKERCILRINGPIGWYPPVDDCQQASQWFELIRDTANKVSKIVPTTKSACPLVCYAN